jgi:hypothetical protein
MNTQCKNVGGIRVGKPDVANATPVHIPGVISGNTPGNYEKSAGHLKDGRSTAERSTGINPEHRNPILPGMPNLSPA